MIFGLIECLRANCSFSSRRPGGIARSLLCICSGVGSSCSPRGACKRTHSTTSMIRKSIRAPSSPLLQVHGHRKMAHRSFVVCLDLARLNVCVHLTLCRYAQDMVSTIYSSPCKRFVKCSCAPRWSWPKCAYVASCHPRGPSSAVQDQSRISFVFIKARDMQSCSPPLLGGSR